MLRIPPAESNMPASKKNCCRAFIYVFAGVLCAASLVTPTRADEGGVSFWLPGQMGSFAAVATEPGWSAPVFYFHESASANASKNFIIGGRLVAGVAATADLLFMLPGYTFKEPVLGGQAAFSV